MPLPSILADFDTTTNALLEQIGEFTPEQLHRVPPTGGWTAAQVVEHLVKAGSGLPGMFQADVEDTTRPPDANVGVIRDIFLNFTTKMNAPEFILPGPATYTKEELLAQATSMMAGIRNAAATSDLSMTCLAFALPSLGTLTRLEWVYFVTYHTQRHTRQIADILRQLNENW